MCFHDSNELISSLLSVDFKVFLSCLLVCFLYLDKAQRDDFLSTENAARLSNLCSLGLFLYFSILDTLGKYCIFYCLNTDFFFVKDFSTHGFQSVNNSKVLTQISEHCTV